MRIAYLGNFGPPHSTENLVAADLRAEGHEVTCVQEGEVAATAVPDWVAGHDVFWWTQTYGLAVSGGTEAERYGMLDAVRATGVPSVSVHLDKWFDLDREEQVAHEPFFRTDACWTADGGNQVRFEALGVRHRWLVPAICSSHIGRGAPREPYVSDVAFVGSWRGGYHEESTHRPALVSWLRRSYGYRVKLWPAGPAVRGGDLSDLYASAKVVVGDSCLVGTPLDRGRYVSDRLPESTGRGAVLLHPHVAGATDGPWRAGVDLECWDPWDWDRLRQLIDQLLADPDRRWRLSEAGMERTAARHTWRHRSREILAGLVDDGLLDPAKLSA